jgi:hypothetical protein
MTRDQFLAAAMKIPINTAILRALSAPALPDASAAPAAK